MATKSEVVEVPAPPSDRHMNRLGTVLAPLSRVTQPKLFGLERIPERPALFVGNHTIYGFLDLPFMMDELWKARQIKLRGLGDHGHYALPVWRDLLELSGMVRGTRENVRALMGAGESVLVFPGGASEVFKSKGQRYRLLWKERLGFARLALEFGYPIVPFAAVGAEEMLDIVADSNTPGYSQVSGLMRRLVGVELPPVVRGLGLTPLPRPERLYFWFGNPIETADFERDGDDAAREVRDAVRTSVESGLEVLIRERDHDPSRSLARRVRQGAEETAGATEDDADLEFVKRAFDGWNVAGAQGASAWVSRNAILEDPPDWPDRAVWHGRDAALTRLEEVTNALGARFAKPERLENVGGSVVGIMMLYQEENPRLRPLGSFPFVAEIADEQIIRMRVSNDEQAARDAAEGEPGA